MFSGQRRWQRSDQGSASMGDLQENSKCPRESWWRFPEGDTALGAAGEVQDSRSPWKKQISSGVRDLCGSAGAASQGNRSEPLVVIPKAKRESWTQGNGAFHSQNNPNAKKTAEQNKQKTAKPEKTSGKTLWGGSRKEETLSGSGHKTSHCKVNQEGGAPWQELLLPIFWWGNDKIKWWGINSLVPQRSGLSSRHSLDQKLCYLQQRKLLRWFPSPLFSQKEEKLSQGRNQIKSSYRTVPFKFCFWWVSHHPTPYIFLFYIPVSVV